MRGVKLVGGVNQTNRKCNSLKICYFNARSLKNKLNEFISLQNTSNYSIFVITETWLDNTVNNAMICPKDFFVLRKDRQGRRGGGVMLGIKDNIKYNEVSVLQSEILSDVLAVDLYVPNCIRLVCIYRAPDENIEYMNHLTDYISIICEVNHPVIILGDFNLPNLDWVNFSWPKTPIYEKFAASISQNSLSQIVNETTRYNNLIDLLLTTTPLEIINVSVEPPFSTSDHNKICFDIGNAFTTEPESKQFYNFKKCKIQDMKNFLLQQDWNYLLYGETIDHIWTYFSQVLHNAFKQYVPITKLSKRTNKYQLPIYIQKELAKKRRLWHISKFSGLKIEYKEQAKKCSKLIYNHLNRKEDRALESGNIGNIFKFINRKKAYKSGIAPLKDSSGILKITNEEKANLLNEYFSSVFIENNGINNNIRRKCSEHVNFANISFSPVIVNMYLKKLKPKLSHTPDGIPAFILRTFSDELALPLSIIFERSFSVSKLPTIWLTADVTPVYKKGFSSDPKNYRPISLTSACCKTMERIFCEKIRTFLDENHLLSNNQHGFRQNRSTVTQLLECLENWTNVVDNHLYNAIDVIYIDFAKAFDKVVHEKLAIKLKSYGITGSAYKWISAFLSNRRQRVKIENSYSSYNSVISGVPQGTVMGPLLFLLFIDDLCDIIEDTQIKLFADDVKLYQAISSTNMQEDQLKLQLSLKKLENYAKMWQLSIATEKCSFLQVGKCNINFEYHINGSVIPKQNNCKDLGILIDKNLKFDSQINNICKKAYNIVNMLFRCFQTNNKTSFLQGYKGYVLPILEYCSIIWSPQLLGDIDKIERVQRYFTRRLLDRLNRPAMHYIDRLKLFNLESLESRRLKADLIFLYKMIKKHVDVNVNHFFTFSNISRTRGHEYKMIINICNTAIRKSFYSQRIIHIWNNLKLPTDTDFRYINIEQFKNLLKQQNLDKYLKFSRNL